MNFNNLKRFLENKFNMEISSSSATQTLGEIQHIVKFRWQEFTQLDKEFIANFFEVDEKHNPPLINL